MQEGTFEKADIRYMRYRRAIVIIILAVAAKVATGQDKVRMTQYQNQLGVMLERVAHASTDNERYLASEEAVQLLSKAIEEDATAKWQWRLPDVASVHTSPDRKLRIFTWAVVRDNGEFECFGAVQYYNEREEEYAYKLLHDKSEEIMNREESILAADTWLGAVYQELIQTEHGGKTYYTLLGWNGVDNLTERKIIEPVQLKGGDVQFGAPVFRRERGVRRIVLEYANDAMVNLGYVDQYVEEVKRERVKVRGSNRYRTVESRKVHKEKMIMFDEVEPQVPGMEGLYQYYVPSGVEIAYAFVEGKWEMRAGAQGRLDDKKLNKDFEPLPKTEPSYNFR